VPGAAGLATLAVLLAARGGFAAGAH
jgi:hypothetical protein